MNIAIKIKELRESVGRSSRPWRRGILRGSSAAPWHRWCNHNGQKTRAAPPFRGVFRVYALLLPTLPH